VILQEASSDELDYVRGWVGLDPANERYFSDFKRIWAESRHLAIHSRINEEDAWQDFQQRIPAGSFDAGGDTDMPDSQVVNMPLRRNYTWLRVAAVFITLLAGGWLYYRYGSKQDQYLSIHSNKNVLSDTLSEGTVVTLNKESSIRYSRLFAGDTRPVELEGEAFFNVTPDKNKPFIVHTQETSIRVLGTSFNVRNTGETTEVIVETGMVEVTNGQHTVRVRAHEKAVIGKKDQPPVKEDIHDELYNYYRTNEFECNGTPLWRMVEKLNEVYKGHIVIGDTQLRDLPLTTTFRVGDESLDEILQVIAQTLKLKITRDGQKIILN
jgi:ferric-dicitrate binding protein FerR (iron transport regulator)